MTDTPRRLQAGEIDAVVTLARVVWQATYPALISSAQIEYMLGERYAPTLIRTQLNDPDHAWWIVGAGDPVAFAHASRSGSECKLDKLYVHPARQRQGLGAALLDVVCDWARAHHATRLWLQVNRGNHQAIRAYEKQGFRILEARVFEIGRGFVMDDYVMARSLALSSIRA
ncbi:MAG: GNAT family N-acetyltransferase [Thiobacillus sp.]